MRSDLRNHCAVVRAGTPCFADSRGHFADQRSRQCELIAVALSGVPAAPARRRARIDAALAIGGTWLRHWTAKKGDATPSPASLNPGPPAPKSTSPAPRDERVRNHSRAVARCRLRSSIARGSNSAIRSGGRTIIRVSRSTRVLGRGRPTSQLSAEQADRGRLLGARPALGSPRGRDRLDRADGGDSASTTEACPRC